MGTRGLYSYRYRRRYWTRYNHWDSYPEGLGTDLVSQIPSDPAELARWIEVMKAKFDEREEKEYNDWDDTVDIKPPRRDLMIEWTYVIDLDRGVFTINGGVHIALDQIPRSDDNPDAWQDAFARDHPARIEVITVDEPDTRHLALYDDLCASPTLVLDWLEREHTFPTCAKVMRLLFSCFCRAYAPRTVGEHPPLNAEFHATAWGIVALATWGEYTLASAAAATEKRFPYTPEWATSFSAQKMESWWHRGTLFVLDAGLRDDKRLRAAVARTVEIWRSAQSPESRQTRAFVVSLRDLVIIDIMPNAVAYSAPIELVPRDLDLVQASPGFAALMEHLTPTLAAPDTDQVLRVPEHVLEYILDYCDPSSLNAMSATCKAVRTLCLRRPRFDVGTYRLLHYAPDSDNVFSALEKTTRRTRSVRVSEFKPSMRPVPVDFDEDEYCDDEREGDMFVGFCAQISPSPISQAVPVKLPLVSLRCDPIV